MLFTSWSNNNSIRINHKKICIINLNDGSFHCGSMKQRGTSGLIRTFISRCCVIKNKWLHIYFEPRFIPAGSLVPELHVESECSRRTSGTAQGAARGAVCGCVDDYHAGRRELLRQRLWQDLIRSDRWSEPGVSDSAEWKSPSSPENNKYCGHIWARDR